MVLVLGAGCCFVKGYVVEHFLHFRLLAKLSQVRMFSFVSKRLSLMMMTKVCCFQRNFSSALPPLVPVKLPSKMYEQQYLYLVFATFSFFFSTSTLLQIYLWVIAKYLY